LVFSAPACKRFAGDRRNQPATSNNANESRRVASADVVKASPQEVDIPRGGSAETIVHLSIQNGYHVNANPPSYPYLKATALDLPSVAGISAAFVSYPNPITRKFSFAEKPLAVYEGSTNLKVLLKANNSAHPGKQNFSGKLHVQACDDQVCYPPGELEVTIPVTIK